MNSRIRGFGDSRIRGFEDLGIRELIWSVDNEQLITNKEERGLKVFGNI